MVNILARGNRKSSKLETGIPDAGNQLNSAYVLYGIDTRKSSKQK
jgi:hypothetical protein